jgi:hypothetical protein
VWCERNSDLVVTASPSSNASFIVSAPVMRRASSPARVCLAQTGQRTCYWLPVAAPARPCGLVEEQNGETSYHVASAPDPSDEPAIANGFREPRMQRIPRVDHDFHVNKFPIVAVTEGRGAQDMVALVLCRKIG